MKYNPAIHHRRSIRLRGYDYSQEGAYYITLCVKHMRCIFGHIKNGEMYMNEMGQFAYEEWDKLPERWPHIELGAFQIMPNHMHGIIIIHEVPPGAELMDLSDPKIQWAVKPTAGQIVGAYKSCVATECLKMYKERFPGVFLGKIWQRNMWERIIRDLAAFDRISKYIINNPANWRGDKFFK